MPRKIIIFMTLALGTAVWWAVAASAATVMSEDKVDVPADRTIDSTLYAAGSNVYIAGTVQGDVFCAGQMVEISGTVQGDVICAAQQLRISGTVQGDVRVVGQMVDVSARVDGSLTAFAQSAQVSRESIIERDATAFGQTLQFNGQVDRDVTAYGESATLGGVVGGDLTITSDELFLNGGAKIAGDLTYTSYNEVQVAQGATVIGQTVRYTPEVPSEHKPASLVARFGSAVYWFGALLLVGVAAMLLRPTLLPATAQAMRVNVWAMVGWGVVGVFAVPIVCVVLGLTILGLPLAMLLLLLWGAVLIASGAISGHWLGQWLVNRLSASAANKSWYRLASLAIGLSVLMLLSIVPIVGGFVTFAAVVAGVGGLLCIMQAAAARQPAAKKKG